MEAEEEMMNFGGDAKPKEAHRIDISSDDHDEISDQVKNWIESVGKAKERSITTIATPSSWPSIPKVPHMVRGTKDFKKFYEPRMISIGPYHHGKPHLQLMEKFKLLSADEFLVASSQSIEQVYKKIESNIGAVRKCYNRRPTNKYDDEKLAWMMLLDGCFVLQYILSDGEIRVLKRHQKNFVKIDLFLLENQLPYGVLRLIFQGANENISMEDKIKEFLVQGNARLASASEMQPKDEPAHLLSLLQTALLGRDKKNIMSGEAEQQEEKQKATAATANKITTHGCCRRRMMMIKELFLSFQCLFQMIRRRFPGSNEKEETQSSSSQGGNNNKWQSFRNIRELKAAGIHFKPSETCFLRDISFESHFFYGYLKLPELFIDVFTKPIFLNLVAYEMCPDAPDGYAISAFLCFLDALIDHPDDVKELRSDKILYNLLGSDDEVAQIFNEITDGLVYSGAYKDVTDCIQAHYDKRVNTWIAQALHDHFSSPWTIMAFIAAVLIILLTGVQTYFAIPGN